MKIKLLFPALLIISLSITIYSQNQNYYLGAGKSADTSTPGISCASCHSAGGIATTMYNEWKQTNHSIATDSGYAQSTHFGYSCLRCHTTGWDITKTNYGADEYVIQDTTVVPNYKVTNQAKWENVKNVGCEACHGAMGSDAGFLSIDHWDFAVKNKLDYSAELCGVCHQGSHHGYYEEWAISGHAKSLNAAGGVVSQNTVCVKCHVGQNAAAYINGTYFYGQDKGKAYEDKILVDSKDPAIQPVTCVVCHDPHSAANGLSQLRISLSSNIIICDKCHNNGSVFGISEVSHRGIADCLSGTKNFGFRFSAQQLTNAGIDTVYQNSAHTFAATERCVDCHVNPDGKNEFGNTAHGHSFKARVEACAKCHLDYFTVVDTSNYDKRFDYRRTQTVTDSLITVLANKLATATKDDTLSELFREANINLISARSEGSAGIHNTRLTQKLLITSITLFKPGFTDLKIDSNNQPTAYSLSQNYPNPFNPQTEIKFDLPEAGNVKLIIYDGIGREVAVLVNNYLNPGSYWYSWNAVGFASGVYIYRIETINFAKVKKMLYLK